MFMAESSSAEKRLLADRGEIDLLHYLLILRKRAVLIILMGVIGLLGALGASFLMEVTFQAKAVIAPVKDSGAPPGLSAIVQQIESVPGVPFSSPSSATEILALLNSGMLRKKAIETYGLLPVVLPQRWDLEKGSWKNGKPTQHEALRALEKALSIRHSLKDNTITITFDNTRPEDAAMFIEKLILTLNSHLSGEARRVAESNRRYLEGQLQRTSDPLIRQNIYTMIAQQIESSMMAGVMENFAFKVIDPPEVPDRKVAPRRNLMSLAGLIIALLTGVLFSFVLEFIEARRNMTKQLHSWRDNEKQVN